MSPIKELHSWVNKALKMPFIFFITVLLFVLILELSVPFKTKPINDYLPACLAILAIAVAIVSFWYKKLEDLAESKSKEVDDNEEVTSLAVMHLSGWVQRMLKIIIIMSATVSLLSIIDTGIYLFETILGGMFLALLIYFFCYCLFFLNYSLGTTVRCNFNKQVEYYKEIHELQAQIRELMKAIESFTGEVSIKRQLCFLNERSIFDKGKTKQYKTLVKHFRWIEDSKPLDNPKKDLKIVIDLMDTIKTANNQ